MKDPLLGKNRALRQAIAYALDIPTFIAQMKNGRGQALQSIVPPPIAGSAREVQSPWYSNDFARAKQKLAEAGYPDGKDLPAIAIEYRHSSGLIRQEFEFHRAQLARVGITLKASYEGDNLPAIAGRELQGENHHPHGGQAGPSFGVRLEDG